MKECTNCHEVSTDFPPDRRNADGLGSWCRDCIRKANREYERSLPKEKKAARARRYRKKKGYPGYRYVPKKKDIENGRQIKKLLAQYKMNQRQLAVLLSVSDAAVSVWVSGKQPLSNDRFREICSAIRSQGIP